MKKQLTNTTNYEPNAFLKVKVVNKPLVDRETAEQFGYDTKVTLTFKAGIKEKPLAFATVDELAEFIGNIDYEEPQQSLPL
jgi:hypothetical protein